MPRIEAAIHPLVAADRQKFIDTCKSDIAVLDIPLLFETGASDNFDLVIVVSAGPEVQRRRVLERPGMTVEKFEFILGKQVPDEKKRSLADVVIRTDVTLEETRAMVQKLVRNIREGAA